MMLGAVAQLCLPLWQYDTQTYLPSAKQGVAHRGSCTASIHDEMS